jgi:hypothetical protein
LFEILEAAERDRNMRYFLNEIHPEISRTSKTYSAMSKEFTVTTITIFSIIGSSIFRQGAATGRRVTRTAITHATIA